MNNDQSQSGGNAETDAQTNRARYLLSWCEDTSIWQAAYDGDISALQGFLDRGADVNAIAGNEDMTPLMCALYANKVHAAWFLLERGADVSVRNLYGSTPLMLASFNGNTDFVRRLIEMGVDINAEAIFAEGETALTKAKRKGHDDIAALLINAGARHSNA